MRLSDYVGKNLWFDGKIVNQRNDLTADRSEIELQDVVFTGMTDVVLRHTWVSIPKTVMQTLVCGQKITFKAHVGASNPRLSNLCMIS